MLSKKRGFIASVMAVCMTLTACSDAGSSSDTAESEAAKREIADPEKITYADSYDFEKLSFDGIEKQECSILVEAEDAKENSGVSRKEDDSASG